MDQSTHLTWRFLFTGQSPVNFWRQWQDFDLDNNLAVSLQATTRDLQTASQALAWFFRAVVTAPSTMRKQCINAFGVSPQAGDIWIVHGDTLSTLLGSIWAKRNGGIIAHIEAGLRSKYIFRPFPEEINRRLVSRLASLHFPQDEVARLNLVSQSVKGDVIPTHGNTLYDALEVLRDSNWGEPLPDSPFVVANIHRNENLSSTDRWECILETLCLAAQEQPVYLVMHPPTELKLKMDSAAHQRLAKAGVITLPRVTFRRFIQLINKSRYVISDGGSNQEECAYLGKPCLILREESERVEGLNESCLLSKFIPEKIHQFLASPESYARSKTIFSKTPSSIVVGGLQDAYAKRGTA
ncbi:UDP-N-acetylglucosamine 2-epimerase [Polynucleobacter sp. es-EL-1]|uniref:UDP-N-acetylglucosamine 2-epimerase n=1 Tax=Polynucleobacter sp. es-EL-1 TaxID=1855652 RepID=UPI001BFDC191|nr:UDP-N-acetylglucosamine 2-epimerase [Polynucleobacter sp. es-EL-1]QWE10858.1 UDP-N-acetylglucosamine 2-epimerase [Polynucleobacter sp. es-EL-1]